jgi:hypothetical protein
VDFMLIELFKLYLIFILTHYKNINKFIYKMEYADFYIHHFNKDN